MDVLLSHHWNGRWGRLNRRDVHLYRTDSGYRVTAREGVDTVRERAWEPPDENAARQLVASLTEVEPDHPLNQGWREIPVDQPKPIREVSRPATVGPARDAAPAAHQSPPGSAGTGPEPPRCPWPTAPG